MQSNLLSSTNCRGKTNLPYHRVLSCHQLLDLHSLILTTFARKHFINSRLGAAGETLYCCVGTMVGAKETQSSDTLETVFSAIESGCCPGSSYKPEKKPDTLDYVFDNVGKSNKAFDNMQNACKFVCLNFHCLLQNLLPAVTKRKSQRSTTMTCRQLNATIPW